MLATGDAGEILELGADCVLYMPAACDFDEVCRLLASGANVVTTRGEFHRPDSMDPATSASGSRPPARQGGTSIHSTGSSPGFITEALPLVLTSIQRRLDVLAISEYADLSRRDSPDLLFNVMGFGRPAAEFDERRFSYGEVSFGPSLAARRRRARHAPGPVDVGRRGRASPAARCRIAAGTIGGRHGGRPADDRAGIRDGQPVLRFCATWYCTADLDLSWDVRATGWHILVEGDAPLDIDIRFPVAARADGRPPPRLHRQPRRQRGPLRLRRPPRHPHDRRPPPDRRVLRLTVATVGNRK